MLPSTPKMLDARASFSCKGVLQPRHIKKRGWGHVLVKSLEIVAPIEDVGRDTISRFDMQFQAAAAYAALEILDGNGIDCVYCDYHDDFVVRRNEIGRAHV